jgi:hypothetical protein
MEAISRALHAPLKEPVRASIATVIQEARRRNPMRFIAIWLRRMVVVL